MLSRITQPVVRFLRVEAASGLVLLAAAVAAIVWANSPWADVYYEVIDTRLGLSLGAFNLDMTLRHVVNDGLMTIFFFLVSLEIKRELVAGELRDRRNAALPAAAALGGMVVPASIYLALHAGTPEVQGFGIPMATDIAFAVGFLSLLGSRIPNSLKVLLLALAIVDDLGAILVIAIFYTSDLWFVPLGLAMAGCVLVLIMQRMGIRSIPLYVVVGVAIWFGFLRSGVHPTIAGVVLGFLTPMTAPLSGKREVGKVMFRSKEPRNSVPPLQRLEAALHPWVAYLIVPVFALANAGVTLSSSFLEDSVGLSVGIAVAAALLVGKPVGIFLFSLLAVKVGLARLPAGLRWTNLLAIGMLAGIGFTVSLFIASVAFVDQQTVDAAKIGVLAGSAVAATLGLLALWLSFMRRV